MATDRPVLIAPSILSADFSQLKDQIDLAREGGADWLHLDIMDGHFVPNLTFGPLVIESIRKHSELPFDTHLMMTNPDDFIDDFRSAGADIITVHYETCPHLHRTIQHIRESGAKAGVSINPATPVSVLSETLNELDLILIMSVNPGFGGQSFIQRSLSKIREIRKMVDASGRSIHVEVDGGIDEETAGPVVAAGANVLVAGYYIFASPDIPSAVRTLRNSATR
jgi:ribulose-phosphate 3-epimerase